MPLTALILLAIGIAATRAEPVGSTLTGLGQLIVGVATLLTVLSTLRTGKHNARKIDAVTKEAKAAVSKAATAADHSATAAMKSTEAAESIGPANGATVVEVLSEIKKNADYQHSRNHDILGAITPLNLAVPALIEALKHSSAINERLLARLDATTPPPAPTEPKEIRP